MALNELTISPAGPGSNEKKTDYPQAKPAQKVGFVSLGCPKNLVDSEVMMGMLAGAGAELTQRAEDADVIVVNTCSFIESAQQESINTILEMAGHKANGRAKKLVVAGCLVERWTVPAVSDGYAIARDAITARVDALMAKLTT